MSFKEEMTQYDEQWYEDQGSPRAFGGPQLEDGKHQVIVTEARVEEYNMRWNWIVRFQNADGQVRKWNNLDHEVGRRVAAQDARDMGYDGPLSGLEEACEQEIFINLVCEIAVKTTAGETRNFTNVYVNRVLGKGDLADYNVAVPAGVAAGEAGGGATDADDDIPF